MNASELRRASSAAVHLRLDSETRMRDRYWRGGPDPSENERPDRHAAVSLRACEWRNGASRKAMNIARPSRMAENDCAARSLVDADSFSMGESIPQSARPQVEWPGFAVERMYSAVSGRASLIGPFIPACRPSMPWNCRAWDGPGINAWLRRAGSRLCRGFYEVRVADQCEDLPMPIRRPAVMPIDRSWSGPKV